MNTTNTMNGFDPYYGIDFLKHGLSNAKPLSESEELAVISIMRDPKKSSQIRMSARNKLILSHTRMICSVAAMMAKKTGHTIADLFQAGVLGIIRAACDYDPDKRLNGKKCKFISYAIWWITYRMNEEIYRSNDAVHVPMYGKYIMTKKFRENNIDADDLRTADFLRATAPVLSIYSSCHSRCSSMEDSSLTIGDTIPDEDSLLEFQNIMNVDEDVKLGEVLRKCVGENDMQILKETYLHGMSLKEMGNVRNLSGEYIRRTRKRSIDKATATLRKLMKEKKFSYSNANHECSIEAIFNSPRYK